MSRKKTHQEFLDQVKDRPFEVIGKYLGVKIKIKFRCNECLFEWVGRPDHIMCGSGCPHCAGNMKRHNRIIKDHGRWLEVDVSTPKHIDSRMFIDKLDWDYLCALGVGRICISQQGYPITGTQVLGGTLIHRMLFPQAALVDHKNSVKYDNRRENLRPCSRAENARNHKKFSTNRSGVTGVCWNKKRGMWKAEIGVDNKNIILAHSSDFAEAVAARKAAEIKYFGEFRRKEILKE